MRHQSKSSAIYPSWLQVVRVVTLAATMGVLGGCSIWPKALTFGSDPEPVPEHSAQAATPTQGPAPVECRDCQTISPASMESQAVAPVQAPAPVVEVATASPVGAAQTGNNSAVLPPQPVVEPKAAAPVLAAAPAPATPITKQVKPLPHGYYVNVGLFKVQANASKATAKLDKAALPVHADTVMTKKGNATRLRVGPYPNRAKADAAAKKVRALKLDAVVIKH
jgi:cell division septation protein DedD